MLNFQLQSIDFQGDMVPPTQGPPFSSDGHPARLLTPSEPYGSALYSPGGGFRLHMQTDGNAVVEVVDDSTLPREWTTGAALNPNTAVNWLQPPLWASGTNDRGVIELAMQDDGNLVIYTGSGGIGISNTSGNPGAFLRMQDDGNLVIYSTNGAALWSTRTNVPGG